MVIVMKIVRQMALRFLVLLLSITGPAYLAGTPLRSHDR